MTSSENRMRPAHLTEEHLTYLDDLRESGETNMWVAGPYLQRRFGIPLREAHEFLAYWMATFSERHSK